MLSLTRPPSPRRVTPPRHDADDLVRQLEEAVGSPKLSALVLDSPEDAATQVMRTRQQVDSPRSGSGSFTGSGAPSIGDMTRLMAAEAAQEARLAATQQRIETVFARTEERLARSQSATKSRRCVGGPCDAQLCHPCNMALTHANDMVDYVPCSVLCAHQHTNPLRVVVILAR